MSGRQVIAFSSDRRQLKVQHVAAQKVLITGATGFVGSHAVEHLVRGGHSIRALVRSTSDTRQLAGVGAELVSGGLLDTASVRTAVRDVDVIIHLAAVTHARSAAQFHRVNEVATRDLVAAATGTRPAPHRFVYLSSLAAAGPSRAARPVRPEDEPRPLTAYGRSKLGGERACLEALNGLEVVVLRAPAVYGPGDRELLRFFRIASHGILPVPTGGARPLQLVHVGDLARAIVLAVTAPQARGIVHIAEPVARPWEEVAKAIARAVGRNARVWPVPANVIRSVAWVVEAGMRMASRSSLLNREKAEELLAPGWLCETETARTALGFVSRIPLEQGLRETARWYRDNGWL
ncbi:MAG: NAD-dependent epimerase/dehydratase family protein [Longimicrobiales bacterium]